MGYDQNARDSGRYTVNITDTGRTGDGVTRIGGLAIFVKNAKAGDKNIKIKITSDATT